MLEQIVEIALEHPNKSPRELAWHITDSYGYYISESSVYRILKSYDLITSPAYIVISAADTFKKPTKDIHELWQTDFSYFKIVGWGWYYLSTVMDDYSRYILAWKLSKTMGADDVMETLDMARERTGIDNVQVLHRPRLLSDNGPCYLSRDLKEYLEQRDLASVRQRSRIDPPSQVVLLPARLGSAAASAQVILRGLAEDLRFLEGVHSHCASC